jgi:hypothetical protein
MNPIATLLATCFLSLAHGNAAYAIEQIEPVEAAAKPGVIAVPLDPPARTELESADPNVRAGSVASRSTIERPEGLPVYTPPRRGAPKTRVGGGTRGLAPGTDAGEMLAVLSPPQMGQTQQAQPTLYWFLSTPDAGPVELALTSAQAVAPLWRISIEGPLNAGIHAVSLRDHNVVLEDGVEYQWSVAIVRDPDRRSRDLVAIGTLERVAARPTPDGAEAVFSLAERGLWYDALQQIEELIAQSTDDPKLREYRAALLDQAELGRVAQYVRDSPAS